MIDLRTAPPSSWPWALEPKHMAQILGRSVSSIYRKMAKGALGKVVHLDGVMYVRRSAFLAALEVAEVEPVQPRKNPVRIRLGGVR